MTPNRKIILCAVLIFVVIIAEAHLTTLAQATQSTATPASAPQLTEPESPYAPMKAPTVEKYMEMLGRAQTQLSVYGENIRDLQTQIDALIAERDKLKKEMTKCAKP